MCAVSVDMCSVLVSLEGSQIHFAMRVDLVFDSIGLSYFPSFLPLSRVGYFFPLSICPWLNPGLLRTRREFDKIGEEETPLNGADGLAFIYR